MKLTLASFVSVRDVDTADTACPDFSALVSIPHMPYKYVGMRRKGYEPKEAWKVVWGNARRHDESVTPHTTSSTMRRMLRSQMVAALKQARDSAERETLLAAWCDTVASLGGFPEYDRYGCALSGDWDYDPDTVTGFADSWVSHL